MLTLLPLQRTLEQLYGLRLSVDVDRFVRPLDARDPEAPRREVVLLRQHKRRAPELAVLLAPEVLASLAGGAVEGLSRWEAWCAAVEGVSHFVLLAFRAGNARRVSQLELEVQAEVDKFAVALVQRGLRKSAAELERLAQQLREALFDRVRFLDAEHTERGQRYRLASRSASRYTRALERRHLSEARWEPLVRELRLFYRASPEARRTILEAA